MTEGRSCCLRAAEAVPSLDGTALRGGARLTWPAVRATSYSVHDVTGGADVTVATTTSAEMTLTGLAGGVPRTYHVVAHNAVGVPTSPSPSVTVTPLAPVVVYVAPFGDDSSPSAGAASSPFRTVAAAIASATASGADEVVLHEGIYSERGPITVDGNLTVRGGFRFAAGAWTDVGGASRVDIDIVGRTGAVACGTASFNSTGRLVVPALLVSPGGRLTLVSLEVTATSAGSGDCYAVVLASDAPLRLDDVQLGVQATGASTCSAGAVGILGASIEIERSNVVGARFTSASLPANVDAAGLVTCDGPAVHVSRSTLAGVSAPALVTSTAVGALVGFAARGASDVYIQRSWVEATRNEYDWDAASGRLAGMAVTASGRVFVANSIVRTPHGGTLNRAIEVGGPRPGSLGALQLYHVTAAIGDDWSVTRAVPTDHRAAALFFTGEIRDVSVHNNLLLLAGGSVNGVNYTGLDRFETTVDPINLRVTGNLFSVPYTSPFVLATLMQCAATEELGSWYDEASLNTPRAHECHGGSTDSWVASGNRAFTFPLGGHPRAVVDVDLDAYPVTPTRVYAGTPPPVPLASEVATDIADLPRSAPVGAGAWAER